MPTGTWSIRVLHLSEMIWLGWCELGHSSVWQSVWQIQVDGKWMAIRIYSSNPDSVQWLNFCRSVFTIRITVSGAFIHSPGPIFRSFGLQLFGLQLFGLPEWNSPVCNPLGCNTSESELQTTTLQNKTLQTNLLSDCWRVPPGSSAYSLDYSRFIHGVYSSHSLLFILRALSSFMRIHCDLSSMWRSRLLIRRNLLHYREFVAIM